MVGSVRLLKSWERIVHVAHPNNIASITSALNSLILWGLITTDGAVFENQVS